MTYQENVIFVAERMAKRRYEKEFIGELTPQEVEIVWNRANVGLKAAYIKGKHADAQIELSQQAEAIREALLKFFYRNEQRIDQYLIENGYVPAPEVKKCDHKNCSWRACNVTNEPICGCCGAYVNTVMTEDEKQEERQKIYDAADINVYKVRERGFLCYSTTLTCDSERCNIAGICKHILP